MPVRLTGESPEPLMVTPFVLLISLLIFPLAVAWIVRSTFVVVTVEGKSMSPTLNHGDHVLALRYWSARWLRTGRIVVVAPWGLPSRTVAATDGVTFTPFIKRIVGMPGDTLITTIHDLDSVVRTRLLPFHDSHGKRVWHIPPEHIFVRGDYPISLFDSLFWGPIPCKSVIALVIMKLPRRVSTSYPPVASRETSEP